MTTTPMPPEPTQAARERIVRVLRLRQQLSKTSTKKYDAMARATSSDGRLRGGWQFYGASRTGRVAGRVLNPANLARPHPDAEAMIEVIVEGNLELLRAMFP